MELPTRLEAGTLNGPGIAGLLTGVMELEKIGLDNIYAKEHELMQAFMGKNKDNPRESGYMEISICCPTMACTVRLFQ